jgi:hypothetical protein
LPCRAASAAVRRRIRLTAALGVGVAFSAGLAVAVFAIGGRAAGGSEASNGTQPLINPTTIVIQGEHDGAGGCRYSHDVVVQPGQPNIGGDQIGEDSQSCTLTVRQGELVNPPPEDTGGSSSSGSATATFPAAPDAGPNKTP